MRVVKRIQIYNTDNWLANDWTKTSDIAVRQYWE